MIPVSGFRPLTDEPKLWRQSRSTDELYGEIVQLKDNESTLPGLCWYDWKEAVDFVWEDNGVLNTDADAPAYKALADEALRLGLTPSYYFRNKTINFKGLKQC